MNYAIMILANALLSVLLYSIEKHTKVQNINFKTKQAIIGFLFGLLSIFATEYGIEYAGAIINVRDASPLCAGLIFGGPAGIISGIIGALYRWFCVLWGGGMYTRIACTISTLVIGIVSALLRKYMFDNKKPSWVYGVGIAVVCEVSHMLMIFLINIRDTVNAFEVVKSATIPMIVSNALAVGISILIVTIISKERNKIANENKQIATTFQKWLLIFITVAFAVTITFTNILQSNSSKTETKAIIGLTLNDIYQDITDTSDKSLLEVTKEIKEVYENSDDLTSKQLLEIANEYGVIGINIISDNNIITNSSIESFIGYDMASGEQSSEFIEELKTKEFYVQPYQSLSINSEISRKYAGINFSSGGFIQVGYDANQLQSRIDEIVIDITNNRHIGKAGFVVIFDENLNIINNPLTYKGENIDVSNFDLTNKNYVDGQIYETVISNEDYFFAYTFAEGYYIVGLSLQNEAMFIRNVSLYLHVFMNIIIFAILFILIYLLIKFIIINNLRKINTSLSKITDGDLEEVVDVRTNIEFASLSDDINSTVETLKRYIAEASSRIDKELAFAKSIQLSALPSVFPPYPDDKSFDIYAEMHAAKEVGGDFYDFYKIDGNKFVFIIADVSGKGIPSAMFMMKAKTIIKDLAESGRVEEDIFITANKKLCENNEYDMFVTAWLGILDTKTGNIKYINAGHNPPLIKKANGDVFYLKSKASFVLGGYETMKYKSNEITLSKGDKIFLYTDGVTEATNTKEELYGEEKLLEFIKNSNSLSLKDTLSSLKNDIDYFVGEAEQFDDITMLILSLNEVDGGEKFENKNI